MATIKLQSSEVLENAETGFIGIVPFKCWSRHGSESFLETILKRNASNAAYHILGPGIERNSRLERGIKHSAKTRRRIAWASRGQTGRGKQEKQYNVAQSVQTVAGAKKRRGWIQMSARTKAKKEQQVVLNSGHGRPPKLHAATYGKEVSARDKVRRDVVKATRVRMG